MRVKFWGTRGSIPVAPDDARLRHGARVAVSAAVAAGVTREDQIDAFIDGPWRAQATPCFGGDTSCVEIGVEGAADPAAPIVFCDLGTGARRLGGDALRRRGGKPGRFDVFMSHLHWDHIMGFPFFAPAYIPGNHIRIHGCHIGLEAAFRRQHAAPSFPVDFSALPARIEFVTHAPGEAVAVAGMRATALRQRHEGDSFGWRFDRNDRAVVYSTDAEHKPEDIDEHYPFVRFARNADLVIFDAMYSLADSISVKEDWGHSSNVIAVELCHMAGAKRLALFHHEPVNDDDTLAAILAETRRLEALVREPGGQPLDVFAARDGVEISV